ncbi:MAG: DUF4249 domain-containing protein [Bacteroidales bacterium]|nr:DUF4249 domain-containing protein [Bacteroidales bacterium]
MRKKIYIVFSVTAILSLLSSCEKIIDLKLSDSSSQIVIQGNIYDLTGPYKINISKTVNFRELNVYPPVSGAIVEISDDKGNSEVLAESDSGTYITSTLRGTPGNTYTLKVTAGGKTYTACSTMPSPVKIDNIYFDKSKFDKDILTIVSFRDTPGIENYYRLIQFVNNELLERFIVFSDKSIEGKQASYSIIPSEDDSKLKPGDKISVVLECIDENVYEYFRTAGNWNGQSASPANPISNISNGVLGYFNACSVRKMSAVVPPIDHD